MSGIKRVFDFTASTLGLVLLAPLSALAAVAVALDSRGGVLYRQERVGRDNTRFYIHKFRTMYTNADQSSLARIGDARVTRVGRLLRATKLDEIPQLWDVLRGKMSLVGPRPELARFVAHWPPDASQIILSVRPGITDPASIHFRDESTILSSADDSDQYYVDVLLPQKVQMYCDYVRTRSFPGDVAIILRTVFSLLRDVTRRQQ